MDTPYIDAEDRTQFSEAGYILLPDAIPPNLLKRWQNIAEAREAEAMHAYGQGDPMPGACVVEMAGVAPRLLRYDNIFQTDAAALLDLLSTPALMAVAREICGPLAAVLQADILYKYQHPHSLIRWHQGGPHDRTAPYLNVGIYLDDAPEGDGCLRYVPATQHGLEDIAQLTKDHGWDVPGVVEQGAKAGDVLVQDMMILHGSQPKHSPGVRRTIYVEYRPYDAVIRGGQQSQAWAEMRRDLTSLVISRAAVEDRPSGWEDDYPAISKDQEAALFDNILANPEPPIPSVYSIHPVEREHYPIPAEFTLSS